MFLRILQHNKSMIVDCCVGEKYIDISILQGERILLSCNAQNRLKFNNCRPGGIMLCFFIFSYKKSSTGTLGSWLFSIAFSRILTFPDICEK